MSIGALGDQKVGEAEDPEHDVSINSVAEAARMIRSTLSELQQVDLADVNQPCVILYLCDGFVMEERGREALAWFPEQQLIKAVSNPHLSITNYMYVASSAGLLCGLRKNNIFNEDYMSEWTLDLAVWNPATDTFKRLPPLTPLWTYSAPGDAFQKGLLQVSVHAAAAGEFTVHVLVFGGLSYIVYTFSSVSLKWKPGRALEQDVLDHDRVRDERVTGEFVVRMINVHGYEPSTRRWTSISCPGDAWNDYPIPQEILDLDLGYGYHRTLRPFLYGSRLLMVGLCSLPPPELDKPFVVILEHKAGCWSTLAWTGYSRLRNVAADYLSVMPRVCGKLVVFPFNDMFSAPTAFDVENRTWLELPESVLELPLQLFCTYSP